MIIFSDKTYMQHSDYPNADWTGKADFIIPDESENANKVVEYYPDYDLVISNGIVADVIKTEHTLTAAEIKAQLAEIDAAEIRPLATISLGIGTDTDISILQNYENKKSQLRAQLAEVENSNG